MLKFLSKIWVICLPMILLLSVIACSADGAKIYGTWESREIEGESMQITFNADGTFISNFDPETGTYSIKGTEINISGGGEEFTYNYEITGKTLKLSYSDAIMELTKRD
ncbi:MAG: lipocalin family protein [Oscillospiraceae bacterium]|nr:lipocalin family protein [Oscillospiraceae bacterium]